MINVTIRTGYSIFLVVHRNLYKRSRAWHILSTCIDISACHQRSVIHQALLSRISCWIIYQAIMKPVKSETRKLYTFFTIWQFYNSREIAPLKSFVISKIRAYKISFVLLSRSFHLSALISFISQDSTNSVTSVVQTYRSDRLFYYTRTSPRSSNRNISLESLTGKSEAFANGGNLRAVKADSLRKRCPFAPRKVSSRWFAYRDGCGGRVRVPEKVSTRVIANARAPYHGSKTVNYESVLIS